MNNKNTNTTTGNRLLNNITDGKIKITGKVDGYTLFKKTEQYYNTNDTSISNKYGDFLYNYKWTYYMTFTTNYKLTTDKAREYMAKYYAHLLKYKGTVMYWVAEKHKHTDGWHTHTLLYVPNECKKATTFWKNYYKDIWYNIALDGKKRKFSVKVEKYSDENNKCCRYNTKTLNNTNATWDLWNNQKQFIHETPAYIKYYWKDLRKEQKSKEMEAIKNKTTFIVNNYNS